jgi:guanyl-specific ribonuclease Sa
MTRVTTIAVATLFILACGGRAGDVQLGILAAHGTIQNVEKGRLTVKVAVGDDRFDSLALEVNGASRFSRVARGERTDESIIVDVGFKDLRQRQPIAVIYTHAAKGNTLLTAVVQPISGERADREAATVWKLPPGVPSKVAVVLKYVDDNGAPPKGYEGGRTFLNLGRDGEETLPRNDAHSRAIRYREWDVNAHIPGKNRGGERLVTGSDGSAYYTSDHYRTFKRIR